MAYEILVGLQVTDQELYKKYRQKMTPILHQHGGDFGYDFHVAEVLKPEDEKQINRVFTIHFPDRETHDDFFSNEEYLAAKEAFFKKAVAHTTLMAAYQK